MDIKKGSVEERKKKEGTSHVPWNCVLYRGIKGARKSGAGWDVDEKREVRRIKKRIKAGSLLCIRSDANANQFVRAVARYCSLPEDSFSARALERNRASAYTSGPTSPALRVRRALEPCRLVSRRL